MTSQLCQICLSIPPIFWSEELDYQGGFPWGHRVKLQPFKSMQAAATRGCQLCKILLPLAKVQSLDELTLEKITLTLSRATIDTHQAVCLAVGNIDISHTTFYRAREPWSKLPCIGIDEHVDNLQIMKTWIQECRQNHEKCVKDLEDFLPTRLLDLQAFKTGDDIRLVSTKQKDFDQAEYLTLSHCWGPPELHPITTTKGNLEERMTRIFISDLSNTFRDAVRITRELGERYLWIDSLCIIQDDEDDWAREAALMAEVYANSYCTLAALSSENSTEGCRLVPNIQGTMGSFVDLDANYWGRMRIRVFEAEPDSWSISGPLRLRAWTSQERELSRRNIHFGKRQLFWECRELKAYAQIPWQQKKDEDRPDPWPIRNTLTESLAPDGPVVMRGRWYDLMEDYSKRDLTKETDKLPALSGLAKHYQGIFTNAKYLAGIWSTHLPAALLWRNARLRGTKRIPNQDGTKFRYWSYIAPTWSWASVDGWISYGSQRLEENSPRIEDRAQETPSDCDFGDLKVEKMYTLPKHNDIYGAIKNAYLVLSGALLAVVDSNPQFGGFEDEFNSGRRGVLTKDGATVGVIYPDTLDELQYAGKLFCLSIRGESSSSEVIRPSEIYEKDDESEEAEQDEDVDEYEVIDPFEGKLVMGLVLKEDLEIEDGYRRIGLARWVKKTLFEDSKSSSITLI